MLSLFGREGLVNHLFHPWPDDLCDDCHPSTQGDPRSLDGLAAHPNRYTPVGT